MQNSRQSWLDAAHGADWFRLNRHDDPEPADPPEPDGDPDPSGDPEPEPEGADKLGDAGKKALDRMKAERAAAKKEAAEARKRADELARKVADFEDRDKSELEKVTHRAERLAEQAAKATQRAVFLDLATYSSDDGDIDTEAITADLESLLERKPHLRRQAAEPPKKKAPKPDPGQGPRPNEQPTDFRTASRQELEAELAQSVPGFRLR
jgi:hypothetical protein